MSGDDDATARPALLTLIIDLAVTDGGGVYVWPRAMDVTGSGAVELGHADLAAAIRVAADHLEDPVAEALGTVRFTRRGRQT